MVYTEEWDDGTIEGVQIILTRAEAREFLEGPHHFGGVRFQIESSLRVQGFERFDPSDEDDAGGSE